MLQAKYKAHRLVNLLFYGVVFLLGFLVGTGAKKLNLNTILGKVLFIDNVNAYNLKCGKITINNFEDLTASYFPNDFDINNYPFVDSYCSTSNLTASSFNIQVRFYDTLSATYTASSSSFNKNSGAANYYQLKLNFTGSNPVPSSYTWSYTSSSGGGSYATSYYTPIASDKFQYHTNYSISDLITTNDSSYSNSQLNNVVNVFNYSSYMIPGLGDLNSSTGAIFDNAPNYDFNKYCWNFTEKTLFTVVPKKSLYDSIDLANYAGEYTFRNGFYVFGNVGNFDTSYNLERGKITKTWYTPTTSTITNVLGQDFSSLDSITHTFDYLSDSTLLQARYTNLFDGLQLLDILNNNTYYYDNLDDLKYSHFVESEYFFNAVGQYSYNIFKYQPTCVSDAPGIGGAVSSGRTCILQNSEVHLNLLEPLNGNLCIYVPTNYEVSVLTENSQGGITGNVLLPNGNNDTYTSSLSQEEGLSPMVESLFSNIHTSDYGLTRIIQAPLVAIEKMSTGTCEPFSISLMNKNITLPCGDTLFWNRQDVQTFRTFWNMFFGGILCYGLGLSIYRSIKSLKDPNDDKIEVIDL